MTANSIKKQDVDRQAVADKEVKRHNVAQENLDARKIKNEEGKRDDAFYLGVAKTFNDASGNLAKLANDFSFYTKYKDLVLNLLKQSIDDYAGETKSYILDETNITLNDGGMDLANHNFIMNKPAITAYKFAPTIGNTDNQASATAIAVKDFNTKVRAANSGSTNYDAVDLFQYPLSMDSILYILSWIERGLSLINYMNPREPFTVAYGLLLAHCDNNASIMKAFLEQRHAIVDIYNRAVVQINALNIPVQMDFIKRHCFLGRTVFFDHEHVGREYYIVNPYVYYVYDEASGAILVHDFFARLAQGGTIISNLRNIVDSQVSALINSQTVNTMSGDITKAFGNGFKLEQLSLETASKLTPILINDTKYLQSFKNAVIAMPSDINELSIKQVNDSNGNPLLYQGKHNGTVWTPIEVKPGYNYMFDETAHDMVEVPSFLGGENFLVDYYDTNSISEEDQCYNLSFYCNLTSGHIRDTRSEILVNMVVYQYTKAQGLQQYDYFESNFCQLDSSSLLTNSAVDYVENNQDYLKHALTFASFNFLPRLLYCYPNPNDNVNDFFLIWNRNRNRNLVRSDLISEIQRNTLISMFSVTEHSENGKSGRRSRKK